MASPASPIADLSYRNYDGPLAPPVYRWWPIAKMTMRLSIKKRSFWVLGVLSAWYFLILSIIFYFSDVLAPNTQATQAFFKQVVWKDMFLDAFSHSQLFLMLICLLIGVGAIANDNRANALLVYLSKPCTKMDYLIGKWVGLFLLMLAVVAGPALLYFGYWALTYRQYGILSDDPWLIVKLFVLFPIAPAFYASISLGISSMFQNGRGAGAVLAGLYFLGVIFTGFVGGVHIFNQQNGPLITTAFYCSIDGIRIALAKMVLGTSGGTFLRGNRGQQHFTPVDIPSVPLFVFLYLGICALMLWIAWSRIRAVEVVGS